MESEQVTKSHGVACGPAPNLRHLRLLASTSLKAAAMIPASIAINPNADDRCSASENLADMCDTRNVAKPDKIQGGLEVVSVRSGL